MVDLFDYTAPPQKNSSCNVWLKSSCTLKYEDQILSIQGFVLFLENWRIDIIMRAVVVAGLKQRVMKCIFQSSNGCMQWTVKDTVSSLCYCLRCISLS